MKDEHPYIRYLDQRVTSSTNERWSWWLHWREIAEFTLPRRYRWLVTPNLWNRGNAINGRIVDNTATIAARLCASGMMSGITSPTRPWFKLKLKNQTSKGTGAVAEWLTQVEDLMYRVFAESNFYNAVGVMYHDLVVFGSACVFIYEDFDNVIHCYNPCLGEFFFCNSPKLEVGYVYREFVMSAEQIVAKWGEANVSENVKSLYSTPAGRSKEVIIRHALEPYNKLSGINYPAKFIDTYWEKGCYTPLEMRGFDEWIALTPRWDIVSNDAYGRGPGMDALGDTKQLQQEQVRKAQAIEKMVNPPLVGDIQLRNQPASALPGGITYLAGAANIGLKPIYQVNPPVQEIMLDIEKVQERIKSTYYNDLFLMISQLNTVRSATEIDARREEKLLMLGPVLERLENEALGPAVRRVFNILTRGKLLPPAPPELAGAPVEVEFMSMLAEAQRASKMTTMERLVGTVGNLAAGDPQVLDKVDFDMYVDLYNEALGNDPRLVRDEKAVAVLREQRAKAQQSQQMMEQTLGSAKAAETLSKTNVGGGRNALEALLG